MLLALLLFIGAGGLLYLYMDTSAPSKTNGASNLTKTSQYQNSVNRHLMLTNENINLEKKRMEIEAARIAEGFRKTNSQNAYRSTNSGLDLATDSRGAEIANDLGRGVRGESLPETPQEVVQADLFREIQQQEYSEAYKEEYARQFIENARRGGYKVILTDDLMRVKSVTPLRNPSQYQGPSDSGGGAIQ